MSSTFWFVRLGDRVLGPLSEAELRDLALRGGVTAQTPVSQDKATWTEAAAVQGIVFGATPPRMPSIPTPQYPQPSPGGRFSPGWLVAGILLGGAGVLVCGLLILAIIGALSGPGETGNTFPGNVPAPAPTRKQIVAQRTFTYWKSIAAVTSRTNQSEIRTPEAMIVALRGVATQIRALPASDVDPDAVQCGNDTATVMGNLGDFIEQSNSPGMLVEAFLRGAAGDPFGKTAEVLDSQSAISQQVKQVQAEVDNTRATLSSRYGVEFPPL